MDSTASSIRTYRWPVLLAAGWLALYTWRSLVGHYSLGSNAFDLSVFDYALWDLVHGGTGRVPFMGYSIFSHHFMPILVVLAPVYALVQSPVFLLLLQLAATAAAAVAFFAVERRAGLDRIAALGLMAVFLLCRRTHSAVAGYFYPECFQALLTFLVVLLWPSRGWRYWAAVILLLATKEDAAIYVVMFALATFVMPVTRNARRALQTAAVAVVWFVVAFGVAIPASRAADGLPLVNPLLESRFGSPTGDLELHIFVPRVFRAHSAVTAANLLMVAGGLPLAGLPWLVPAVPGIIINLAADPESMQAGLNDHYVWPILPWIFIAAAYGLSRLLSRRRAVGLVWIGILLAATMVDSPALQRMTRTRLLPEAREVRRALPAIHEGMVVHAMPNLIPHLPHSRTLFAVGGGTAPPPDPDLVLVTDVGNLWPLSASNVRDGIASYMANPAYDYRQSGRLYIFTRRAKTTP